MGGTQLRERAEGVAPALLADIDALCGQWLSGTAERARNDPKQFRPKQINDPIWGSIELRPAEVALLDSPLLQRMRGVRQLGLAPLVFPSATHDRLEHIIGVIGAVDRMCDALSRQIERWNGEHKNAGEQLPAIRPCERNALRLAALFHDLGHGPFSHALEPVLDVVSPIGGLNLTESNSWRSDLADLRTLLMAEYSLNARPATSEVVAIAILLSKPVGDLLAGPLFATEELPGHELQHFIAACLIGALDGPGATHLSQLISGQVDADRLDYLVRDSYHAGLEIGFDTHRLLAKLEVLQVRDSNLKSADRALRERISKSQHGVFHQIGIAASGYGSFEQMLIGRTFLYDRLYHHHKIRAAEAMAQRMLLVAERDRRRRFDLAEIFLSVADDTFIRIVSGEVTHPRIDIASTAAASLAHRLLQRDLLHRAFAFRGRLIGSPPGLDEIESKANRDAQWREVAKATSELKGRYELGAEIHGVALEIAAALGKGATANDAARLTEALTACGPEQVIVDLPANKADAIRILARYPDGSLKPPEFSFNPHKWTEAYEQQKRTGYVFCPKDCVPVIALASRIVFLRRFGIAMGEDADGYIKVGQMTDEGWISRLIEAGLMDQDVADALTRKRYSLLRFREADLGMPSDWLTKDPDLAFKLTAEINRNVPGGLSVDGLDALGKVLPQLWRFVDVWFEEYLTREVQNEADLQARLRAHLRASLHVEEGTKAGGGAIDLFVEDHVLIENKFAGSETEPRKTGKSAALQGRRYTLALRGQVIIVVNAYRHKTGTIVPDKHELVSVEKISDADRNRVQIRIDLPFAASMPSAERESKA